MRPCDQETHAGVPGTNIGIHLADSHLENACVAESLISSEFDKPVGQRWGLSPDAEFRRLPGLGGAFPMAPLPVIGSVPRSSQLKNRSTIN